MGPGETGCKDKPSVSEPEKCRENDELVKQEMLVQYLQDAYSFSLKITEAIGIISKMMYEHTTTGTPASPLQGLGLGVGRTSLVRTLLMSVRSFERPGFFLQFALCSPAECAYSISQGI